MTLKGNAPSKAAAKSGQNSTPKTFTTETSNTGTSSKNTPLPTTPPDTIPLEDSAFDEFDEILYPRPATTDFDRVVEESLSRRGFLGAAISTGITSFAVSIPAMAKRPPALTSQKADFFGFEAVAANGEDTITLPKGYSWQTLIKWGDPLWSDAPAFDETTGGTPEAQKRSFGDNNDGMALFEAGNHTLLVVNNEYINKRTLLPTTKGHKPETIEDANKAKAAHGISVIEIKQQETNWEVVLDSPFNRRITADTPIELTGPAAGHPLLQTEGDPAGFEVKGTINNCGNGQTPWGTYLSCEENFNGYFSSSNPEIEITKQQKRYGIGIKDSGYQWARFDDRFDIAKHPNEANRFGYVVELDPKNPTSPVKKRTRLGRFKHENAELVIAKDGRVVVYMGDDEHGEYLYKYVSRDRYSEGKPTSTLLDKGTLYVAKFYNDQKGAWLPLTPETTSLSEAEICIHTRLAASKVGGTTMDRPEWVAADPTGTSVYCALTNNKNRGLKPNKGGDDTPIEGPNPRANNLYGQIVKWMPDQGDHTASGFEWNLFAMAGNPDVHADQRAGSSNITADNMFNAPDGLHFDHLGRLWIQTDGKTTNTGDFAGMGNNQMLVGNPETGEIRRFLVGPKECEVTGLTWAPDKTTLFVGIQHPGGRGDSTFPLGNGHPPRSCVIAIRREDGGKI